MAQTTSAAWKAAHKLNFLPQSFVEISYRVTDPEAEAAISSVTSNDVAPFATDISAIMSGLTPYNKYATLEHNAWALDGSFPIYDVADIGNVGYVSNSFSQNDGTFATSPVISITFSSVQTTPISGVTVQFSNAFGEMARAFTIRALNGGTAFYTQNISNNYDTVVYVDGEISNYDEIQIEITEWCLPKQRARIESVVLGEILTFTKSDLIDYTHNSHCDLLSLSLPVNQVSFSLNNVDAKFNPANPDGIYKYLIEKQEMAIRYGMKVNNAVEWIKGGTFFLTGADIPQNGITATFTARDIIAFMEEAFVPTIGNTTLKALAEDAFTQSNIPSGIGGANRWDIDDSLADITVTVLSGTFAEGTTCAEVVQYCANAGQCVMYEDRSGIMHVKPLSLLATGEQIGTLNTYSQAEYSTTQPLKGVNVNKGQYVLSAGSIGEVQEITNPLIQDAGVAEDVAKWVASILINRFTLSGTYRPDLATDPLDYVTVNNKYASSNIAITDLTFTFNGAVKGEYVGRAM